MDALRAYRCQPGETKSVIVRGIEDDHSPAGHEPNFVRAERQFPDTLTFFSGGSYDQIQADRRMTDSFITPANVARGLFLIRLKPVADNTSDTIGIGDVGVLADPGRGRFSSTVVDLEKRAGWSRRGEVYSAELRDIMLHRAPGAPQAAYHRTLLDLMRQQVGAGWVDVIVQDDTSVDFMGMALCVEPPRGNGLSLAPWRGEPLPGSDLVTLTCSQGGRDQHSCNPYVGDMPCTSRLPVACFRPMASPLPRRLKAHFAGALWSGGQLAFTEPQQGSRFARSHEVDAFCEARFGGGWRAAVLHDGGSNMGISGLGDPGSLSSRVWVDIVDGPYATCWAR